MVLINIEVISNTRFEDDWTILKVDDMPWQGAHIEKTDQQQYNTRDIDQDEDKNNKDKEWYKQTRWLIR